MGFGSIQVPCGPFLFYNTKYSITLFQQGTIIIIIIIIISKKKKKKKKGFTRMRHFQHKLTIHTIPNLKGEEKIGPVTDET